MAALAFALHILGAVVWVGGMALPRALAHAAAKRELVAVQQPVNWTSLSILRSPEVLTESELVEADGELKAPQRHALAILDPENG